MFGIYNKLNKIKNKRLRESLLNSYCVVAIFIISAFLAIPIALILCAIGYYIVIPLLFFVCCFIPWLIEGGKQ